MALHIISADERMKQRQKVNIALFGPSGSGKTFQANTLDPATTMPVERARTIFKFAVSVPEKIYDGIKAADPELGKSIDSARTTKQGAIKITLTKED